MSADVCRVELSDLQRSDVSIGQRASSATHARGEVSALGSARDRVTDETSLESPSKMHCARSPQGNQQGKIVLKRLEKNAAEKAISPQKITKKQVLEMNKSGVRSRERAASDPPSVPSLHALHSTLCADAPPFDISKIKRQRDVLDNSSLTSLEPYHSSLYSQPFHAVGKLFPNKDSCGSFENTSQCAYPDDVYFVGERSTNYCSPYRGSPYAVSSLCLHVDGLDGSTYVYNTSTREVHTIPFIPKGLTALPDRPQEEMYLIKPIAEVDDIHYPSYIKCRDQMHRKMFRESTPCATVSSVSMSMPQDERAFVSSEVSKMPDATRRSEYSKLSQRSAPRSEVPNQQGETVVSSEKNVTRARSTGEKKALVKKRESLQLSKFQEKSAGRDRGATEKHVGASQSEVPHEQSESSLHEPCKLRTEIFDGLMRRVKLSLADNTGESKRVAKKSRVKRDALQSSHRQKATASFCYYVHLDMDISAKTASATGSKVEFQSTNDDDFATVPVPRRPSISKTDTVSETRSSTHQPRRNKTASADVNSMKLSPVTPDLEKGEDVSSDTEWIDTAPTTLAKKKKKDTDGNKSDAITVKKKKSDAKEFDDLLHCIAQAKKRETPSESRALSKFKAENSQLRRDYVNIIEKADACKKNPAARILLLQQALPLAEQTQTATEINHRVVEMAELYNEVGEFKKAQEYADRVLCRLSTESSEDDEHADLSVRCNIVIGRSYESLVQPERAKPFFDEAFQHVQKTANLNQQASILGHLGIVHELMGDYATAFDLYDKTLEMAKTLNDRRVLCETSANLGLAHLSIGDLDVAEKILAKNIPVARSLRDYTILSRAMTNMAHVQLLKGNLDMAAHYHEQELEINQENQDSQGVAQALSCLGNVRKAEKNYEEATRLFVEEFCVVQRLGNETRLLESLGNCGTIYRTQKKLDKAREFHQRERQCAESTNDPVYLAKAILNLADIDITEALMKGSCRDVLLRTAIERYNRSLYLVCEGVPVEERQLYMIKVGCCEAEWRALDGLETAYRLLEDGERAIWCADAKHLPLVTQIMRKSLVPDGPKNPPVVEIEICESSPVTEIIPASTEKHSTIQSSVHAFLKRKFLHYDIRQLMRDLGIDALVLYSMFWEDGQEMFAYVMHGEFADWKIVPLVFSANSSKVLASQQGRYRTLIAGDDLDMPLLPHSIYSKGERAGTEPLESLEESIGYLYDDFFEPLEVVLSAATKVETVCIVTDGLITNIPFAMLKDRDDKFLVERFAFCTVPSVEQLVLLAQRREKRENVTPDVDVLSLRVSTDAADGFTELENSPENFSRVYSEVNTASELLEAVNDVSANLTVLSVPTMCEMREDYTGSFRLHDERVSSEDIVEKWTAMRWKTVLCDEFSCFTYRVIHESCISLTRALVAAGADRVVGMLWLDAKPSGGSREGSTEATCARSLARLDIELNDSVSVPSLASVEDREEPQTKTEKISNASSHTRDITQSLVEALAAVSTSDEPCAIAKALQRFQITCIHNKVSRWKWGKFTIIGLP